MSEFTKGPMIYCGNYRCVTEGSFDVQGPLVKEHEYNKLAQRISELEEELEIMTKRAEFHGANSAYWVRKEIGEMGELAKWPDCELEDREPQQQGDVIAKMIGAYNDQTTVGASLDGMTAAAKVCTDERDKYWMGKIEEALGPVTDEIWGNLVQRSPASRSDGCLWLTRDWLDDTFASILSRLLPEGNRTPEERVTISEGCGDFESWTVALDGRSRVSFGIGGKEDAEVYRLGLIAQLRAADRGQG